ncbi:hypothetical protein CDO73_08490 [Saccharibacillus sp. O23]|uniref:vWA domain-containing protein n=1 Tax=Saccharibacillus sp. O23 TaxID=2009338 RepID=UPI000B4DF55D|nr:vWA domain-containing protein [Saccharibacillus sp. O23]OWR31164.1 hypothetical protein CDO73_08490 [Saccharibacillus sp. O23]
MKRRMTGLWTGIWTAALLWPAVMQGHAEARATGTASVDAVLVLDASHSMNESDPQGISAEAMKMFIDMLPASGSRVGIVSYTDKVQREKALLEIRGESDKQELKTFVGQLDRGPFTDTAVGVTEAVRMLLRGEEAGRDPMIVLLADGNTSLDSEGTRTRADSAAELAEAAGQAKDAGIPIYTIGLNADGTLNRGVLRQVSDRTGGKAFVTDSAADLPDILSEIFAGHQQARVMTVAASAPSVKPEIRESGRTDSSGESRAFSEFRIEIPDGEVIEANASIKGAARGSLELLDPNGRTVPIPSDRALLSESSAYALLKLVRPEQGTWTLRVQGTGTRPPEMGLVFSYDFELAIGKLGPYYERGSKLDVSAYLERSGRRLNSPELYRSARAALIVREEESGAEEKIPLSLENGRFVGSYTLSRAYNYDLTVRAESASFYRESKPVRVEVSGSAPREAAETAETKFRPLAALAPAVPGLLGAAGVAALAALVGGIARANRRFAGRLLVEIVDEHSGRLLHAHAADLTGLRGRTDLLRLLGELPESERFELRAAEGVTLRPGRGGAPVLRSRAADAEIRRGGLLLEAAGGLPLSSGERVEVLPAGTRRIAVLEYRSRP